MDSSVLAMLVATAALVISILWSASCHVSRRGVPHITGWPVLGSLPAFATKAVDFITTNRARLGGTFSVDLMFQPVVFLTNVLDHATLYRFKKEADMHEFTTDFTANIAGISKSVAEKWVIPSDKCGVKDGVPCCAPLRRVNSSTTASHYVK